MKRTFHRHTPIACDTQYDVLEISWYYICIQPQFQLPAQEQKLGAMGHRALLEYSPEFILNETQPVFLFDVV